MRKIEAKRVNELMRKLEQVIAQDPNNAEKIAQVAKELNQAFKETKGSMSVR